MVECKDTLGRTASANLKLPITKRKEAINIQKDIINASGKKIGYVDISDEIVISNNSKPVIKITNKQHIKSICNKEIAFIKSLYDDYTLTVAEIAALYDMKYFQTANIIKTLDGFTLRWLV